MFYVALNSMLVILFYLLIGFTSTKVNVLSLKMTTAFTSLLLYITVPSLILTSLSIDKVPELEHNFILAIVLGFIYHLVVLICVYIGVRKVKMDITDKKIFMFAMIFANTSYMGYPLIESIFGSNGLFYAVLINISFNVLGFTVGEIILDANSKISVKKIVLNPALIATLIGTTLFILEVKLPNLLYVPLKNLGAITSPLSMILVGVSLCNTNILKTITNYRIYIFSIFKLLVIPFSLFFVLKPFISDDMLLMVTVILSGTPAAILTVILSHKNKFATSLPAEIVFLSTILSVLSIPLVAYTISLLV